MMEEDESGLRDEISYQLRLSFAQGDANLDAKFWYARHCVLYGDAPAGYALFRELANAETQAESRSAIKGLVVDSSHRFRRFSGSLEAIYDIFCFVRCADIRGDAFAHSSEFRDEEWAKAVRGDSVEFELAFTFKGPVALHLRVS